VNKESFLEILKEHPFTKDLSPEHQAKLAELAHETRFEREQIIFHESDASQFFYLILKGKVALEVMAPGRALRIQTLTDGEEFSWSSLLPSTRKFFQARALTSVRALVFDAAQLRASCDQDCSFGYAFISRLLAVVAGRLQATRLRLLDMYGVQERTTHEGDD